jgi:hypothetical protein
MRDPASVLLGTRLPRGSRNRPNHNSGKALISIMGHSASGFEATCPTRRMSASMAASIHLFSSKVGSRSLLFLAHFRASAPTPNVLVSFPSVSSTSFLSIQYRLAASDRFPALVLDAAKACKSHGQESITALAIPIVQRPQDLNIVRQGEVVGRIGA